MSICPKNKTSRGRRDKRRANWKMSVPSLSKCPKCGELMLSHRINGRLSQLSNDFSLRYRRILAPVFFCGKF